MAAGAGVAAGGLTARRTEPARGMRYGEPGPSLGAAGSAADTGRSAGRPGSCGFVHRGAAAAAAAAAGARSCQRVMEESPELAHTLRPNSANECTCGPG